MVILRSEYTVSALARKWECTEDDIEHLIETRELKAKVKKTMRWDMSTQASVEQSRANRIMPDTSLLSGGYYPGDKIIIAVAEVERYEAKHFTPATLPSVHVNDDTAGETQTETDQQLCKRLKTEGWSGVNITRELISVFPSILDSRIGRLLPANPGANITNDAHKKRGMRLRKKAYP